MEIECGGLDRVVVKNLPPAHTGAKSKSQPVIDGGIEALNRLGV